MEYRRKSSCSIEEKKKNKNNSNVQVNSLYGSSSLRSIVVCYKRERLDEKATTAISMPLYSWWIAFACDCMLYASVFLSTVLNHFFRSPLVVSVQQTIWTLLLFSVSVLRPMYRCFHVFVVFWCVRIQVYQLLNATFSYKIHVNMNTVTNTHEKKTI